MMAEENVENLSVENKVTISDYELDIILKEISKLEMPLEINKQVRKIVEISGLSLTEVQERLKGIREKEDKG
jgi:hypothetical protein